MNVRLYQMTHVQPLSAVIRPKASLSEGVTRNATPLSSVTRVNFSLRATCSRCKLVNVPATYNESTRLIVCALCTMTGKA